MSAPPLLIADGMIATTSIVARVLRDAYGDIEVITTESLVGRSLQNRPLFVSRVCHPRYRWLPDYLGQHRLNYVYVLDDNFFELREEYDAHNGAFFSHPAVHDSLTAFLSGATRVWVMSELLETYLKDKVAGIQTQWIAAPVDIELFDTAAASLATNNAPSDDGVFKVGYPTTRRQNVRALVASIVRLSAERWGDAIRFEFVGWCPDDVREHPNVTSLPATTDYAAFARLMHSRRWNAAIAPLSDSVFENCKTNVKFREYGAARIAGIYSRGALFGACISHAHNGLLADWDANDWVNQIARLKDDCNLADQIVRRARTDVERIHAQPVVAVALHAHFSAVFDGARL